MGICACDTQCLENQTCEGHLGCVTYSDPVDPSGITFPTRPTVGESITPELLNNLMGILYDSVHSDYSDDILPDNPLGGTRPPTYTKRRATDVGGDIPDQPVNGGLYDTNVTGNEIQPDDSIVPERDGGFNYALDYNGLVDYLSDEFKYTFTGETLTYLANVDAVDTDDIIEVKLLQRLWDGVYASVTDCVCNYDRCDCNASFCACNNQCTCEGVY